MRRILERERGLPPWLELPRTHPVRAGLRLLEEEETKLSTLRKMLGEGEISDFVEYSLNGLIDELDSEAHQ